MKLALKELAEKHLAGTLTDAELQESGYMMHQVKAHAENLTVVDANVSNLPTRKSNLDQEVFMSPTAISHSKNVGEPIVQTLLR